MSSLLVILSSRTGRTEHFLLFHTHLLTHGYQPTPRKVCKAQRGAELPALGTPWGGLSRHSWPHLLKPKCAAETGEGTNTFQDIISTMREGCAAATCQEKCHAHHNPQIHSHHATPLDQQLLINLECGSALKHLLLSLRPTESDEEESLCITPSRTCCKHIWQHREVPLWHNPFLYTPNIFRFSTDCQECL